MSHIKKAKKKYLLNSNFLGLEGIVYDFLPGLNDLPSNALNVWYYVLGEIISNVIDHSGGSEVVVQLKNTALSTEIIICDNGEGIFKKIQRELGLCDERQAVLELTKRRLTTDPVNHTGEGTFLPPKLLDEFVILSNKIYFSHHQIDYTWTIDPCEFQTGTTVFMKMKNNTCANIDNLLIDRIQRVRKVLEAYINLHHSP